ncbi:lyase family protein [Rhodoferax sp.]|uniref:lyase family protein n=1 Tax=Rhodoferax sp. TaxID=50421 RepID=UPI0028466477|nr:lyase family protein [Rhodoferax sp.]MDR3371702.1 lyase family protein [Rhodoferax sp.]
MNSLFERLLSTPEVMESLSDRHFVQAMLRFEAALARAQASVGLIPQAAAQSIVGTCKVELFDVLKLVREAGSARCAVIPLVKSLRETVGLFNPEAERYVHFACGEQDLADTALALITRDALDLIKTDLDRVVTTLLKLAAAHADDPMLARAALQPASVTTFGLKCAQWSAPLQRAQQRLRMATDNALSVQLGGRVGTQAEMQGKGPLVTAMVATELKLKAPAMPWLTQRDEWVALGCELALMVGSLSKIAGDMALMAQFEVDELAANVDATQVVLAAGQRVPQQMATLLGSLAQEHEGGLGSWQAALTEWPALLMSTHGAMRAMAQALAKLQVHPLRMRSHLEACRAGAATREEAAWFAPSLAQHAAEMTQRHLQTALAPQPDVLAA